MRRLMIGLGIAIGVLVLGLSGTCTLVFAKGAPGALGVALIFGGPFMTLGVLTLVAMASSVRSGGGAPLGPALGVVYMILGAVAVIVGVYCPGVWKLVSIGGLAIVWFGWRLTLD